MTYQEFEKAIADIIIDISNEKPFFNAVMNTSEDDVLIKAHHGYGRYIRNSKLLWEDDSPLSKEMREMGFTHAHDMSSTLIKCAIRDIKDEPRDIQKDIERYREHWKKFK